ncbi:ricin B lectin domain-containing protein [Umbelopsis sp. PMI_123]|nr:ricin B lectin domain-containing protein [Umbelopsis sp. PMI_123]
MAHIPRGPFYIGSQYNGRVIDVEGASVNDNAHIIVWDQKSKDASNQLWEYRNGAFVNVNSGKVLEIKGGYIHPDGYIHSTANPNLVLDIKGAEDKSGASVILYEKRAGGIASNQRWELVPADF